MENFLSINHLPLSYKSLTDFRCRHHTNVSFAEHFETILRKKFVEKVPDKRRHDDKSVKPRPRAVEPAGDSQRGGRIQINFAVFNQNHRIGFGFIYLMFLQKTLADFRLVRCEFEILARVALDDEIHRTVTEITLAVEKNNCAHIF